MISVLLVDDDYLVRMYLRQLIDWEKEGFLLVGDACNGEEALEMMKNMPVQLVITDISMPVMDGITLIRRMKEAGMDAGSVVLSCHDEFEFVKEAMRLGADEYVLKNDLNEESLRGILASMREKIAQSKAQQNEQDELWKLAQKGSEQLKREALALLRNEELPFTSQSKLLMEHTWKGLYYHVGVIALDLRGQKQLDSIVQVCRQLLRGRNAEFFIYGEETGLVVADLSGIAMQSEQWEQMQQLAGSIMQTVEQYVAAFPCIAVSRIYAADGGVTKALRQAESLLEHGFYGHRLVLPDAVKPFASQLPASAQDLMQRLEQPGCDADTCAALFEQTMAALKKEPVSPALVREWINRIEHICGTEDMPPQTIGECEERLARYRALWRRQEKDLNAGVENPAVLLAAKFVRENFSQQISLNIVAEEVRLNPAYLSHIFKKEMGVSFTEYLLAQRMEYVMDMLRRSDKPAKEIALAAGFFDYRHFSKLFKKQTGMRPAEWRRKT